jgi:hypothetical protein
VLLEKKRVDEIAASILEKGLQAPILVRADGACFVLVEGLHRLEAAKAVGAIARPYDRLARRPAFQLPGGSGACSTYFSVPAGWSCRPTSQSITSGRRSLHPIRAVPAASAKARIANSMNLFIVASFSCLNLD